MKYTTPITDRTALDVTNKTAKAFFNVADWQRIYNNTQVTKALVDFLLSINITFNTVATPTITTIPTVTELNTLLANIERIRLASNLPAITGLTEITSAWLAGSSVDAPDYLDVNEWEKVIESIRSNIINAVDYAIHCGVATSGQVRFYQARWRKYAWIENSETPSRLPRTGLAITGTGLQRQNTYRRT